MGYPNTLRIRHASKKQQLLNSKETQFWSPLPKVVLKGIRVKLKNYTRGLKLGMCVLGGADFPPKNDSPTWNACFIFFLKISVSNTPDMHFFANPLTVWSILMENIACQKKCCVFFVDFLWSLRRQCFLILFFLRGRAGRSNTIMLTSR